VLVVGVGQVGLAAGMALRQARLTVMIVDAGDQREGPDLATTTA
jgi:cation diffusion facilitator CzcD-associated flavoprotein CzcO